MNAMTVGIVLARMTSTRLPGKALARLGPMRVLDWVVGRARQAKMLSEVIVATTTAQSDNPIVEVCHELNVRLFRGDEHDVLGRFIAAADQFGADLAIRINADNPLIDPTYVNKLVACALEGGHDYVSYHLGDSRPVMLAPIGFFAEAISRPCLTRAQELIADSFEREHVTLGIYQRPSSFCVRFLNLPVLFDYPYLRFTLDTPNDLQLLNRIVTVFGERAFDAGAEEFVRLVEQRSDWQTAMSGENKSNPKSTK